MTLMLQLSDGVWVNALDVTEVRLMNERDRVLVRMRDGREIIAVPDYGSSMFALQTRLIEHINHAAATYSGKVEHAEPKFKSS